MNSQFRVAVINDEISQDFGHAVDVASREFGMNWIELRGMWNKNILKLDSKEIDDRILIFEAIQPPHGDATGVGTITIDS